MREDIRGAAIRRVLWVTLALNALVAGFKWFHGIQTGTLSVKADGLHSAVDGVNNLVGLLGVWWSLRPPDRKHPYGHHKMEVLAACVVGGSLLLMAGNLIVGAVKRLGGGGLPPAPTLSTMLLLVGTLVVNGGVAHYEAREAKRLQSSFLESDASHTRSDILVTIGVLVTVVAIRSGYLWVDAVFTCLIALFIFATGVQLVRRNFNYLTDSAQVDANEVESVACRIPGVAGVHKIRTCGIPGAIRMDLHIQVARHLNVNQAHTVTHWVISALKSNIKGVQDVTVHTEPALAGKPYPDLPASLLSEN